MQDPPPTALVMAAPMDPSICDSDGKRTPACVLRGVEPKPWQRIPKLCPAGPTGGDWNKSDRCGTCQMLNHAYNRVARALSAQTSRRTPAVPARRGPLSILLSCGQNGLCHWRHSSNRPREGIVPPSGDARHQTLPAGYWLALPWHLLYACRRHTSRAHP